MESIQTEISNKKPAMPKSEASRENKQLEALYPVSHIGPAAVFIQFNSNQKNGTINLLNLARIINKLNMGAEELLPRGKGKAEVKFKTAEQANKFISCDALEAKSIKAYIPRHLIERKGIIKGFDLDLDPSDLLIETGSPCKIKMARRLNKRIINKDTGKVEWIPSQTVLLTFEGTILPNFIKAYNLYNIKVEVYVEPIKGVDTGNAAR